jgi:hypothetical protein
MTIWLGKLKVIILLRPRHHLWRWGVKRDP